MSSPWPFSDPPNVAVFTRHSILSGQQWIQTVTHDADDGAWQFHPQGAGASDEEAAVVSLESIALLEPAVNSLADLPLGWRAWRPSREAAWLREPAGLD